MGWRADQAYEEVQRKAFQEWKASLTWREYLAWQWSRWRYVLAGPATAALGILLMRLLA